AESRASSREPFVPHRPEQCPHLPPCDADPRPGRHGRSLPGQKLHGVQPGRACDRRSEFQWQCEPFRVHPERALPGCPFLSSFGELSRCEPCPMHCKRPSSSRGSPFLSDGLEQLPHFGGSSHSDARKATAHVLTAVTKQDPFFLQFV